MSRILAPKVRTNVRLWGRFLLLLPKTSRAVSFLRLKYSSELGSSKGWIGFFLVNFLASGMRSRCRSARQSWVTWEHDVPRRKRHVLGFSCALGALFSRARFERAFRGLISSSDMAGVCRGWPQWRRECGDGDVWSVPQRRGCLGNFFVVIVIDKDNLSAFSWGWLKKVGWGDRPQTVLAFESCRTEL